VRKRGDRLKPATTAQFLYRYQRHSKNCSIVLEFDFGAALDRKQINFCVECAAGKLATRKKANSPFLTRIEPTRRRDKPKALMG
jgi:hypothetical protein